MDLAASLQNIPPQQAQTDPPPVDYSLGPAIPPLTTTPSPAGNTAAIYASEIRKLRLYHLGKRFGHIPGVPVLSEWQKRIDLLDSAVHRSLVGGICGNKRYGAYSIVLSDSYNDDEDGGDVILYTGSGGREPWSDTFPPKRLRIGPQTHDQSWETPLNTALKVSFHTGNPVRVVRSWRCPSQYAPLCGYRYDGLYKVAACWTARGHGHGKKICRCRLERQPDQPDIPLRPAVSSFSRWSREPLSHHATPVPSTSPQCLDILKSRVLSTYVWDAEKKKLVKLPISDRTHGEAPNIAEVDEEEHGVEDDVTLV